MQKEVADTTDLAGCGQDASSRMAILLEESTIYKFPLGKARIAIDVNNKQIVPGQTITLSGI